MADAKVEALAVLGGTRGEQGKRGKRGHQGPAGPTGPIGGRVPPRWGISARATSNVTGIGGYVMRVDPTLGGFSVSLPIAVNNAGEQITIKNQSTSANVITILPTGGDTIDGGVSATIAAARGSLIFISDGISDWMAVS
jgi:hypothetical protein